MFIFSLIGLKTLSLKKFFFFYGFCEWHHEKDRTWVEGFLYGFRGLGFRARISIGEVV